MLILTYKTTDDTPVIFYKIETFPKRYSCLVMVMVMLLLIIISVIIPVIANNKQSRHTNTNARLA